MQPKYKAILADTSCFILLDKIGEVNLMQAIFGTITTTEEVGREFGKPLPAWVKVQIHSDMRYKEILSFEVDPGEASVIALALELPNCLLILDDYKARKVAHKLGLNYTGTLGILLKAKEIGIIEQVGTVLEKVQRTNFRFSEDVLKSILNEAGE